MRKSLFTVLLFTLSLAAQSALAIEPGSTSIRRAIGLPSDHVAPQMVANAKNGIEHLDGSAAIGHINNLKARKARAMAEAEKRLRDRGCKPTEIAHVVRSVGLAGRSIGPSDQPFVRVQSVSDGSGELDFWSWDDGDNSTWEGVIYYESYDTGLSVVWDAQVDVSTSSPYTVWEDTIAADQGGTNLLLVRKRLDSPVATIASSASPSAVRALTTGVLSNDFQLTRLPGAVRDWLACTVAGCAGAALGCLYGGPAWAPCFGLWCGGTALGCAAGVAIMHYF